MGTSKQNKIFKFLLLECTVVHLYLSVFLLQLTTYISDVWHHDTHVITFASTVLLCFAFLQEEDYQMQNMWNKCT